MTVKSELRIGLIADTHGLLRPAALEVLRGSDFIIHAGDVGDPRILATLAAIAPLTAVRGNNDGDRAYVHLPERAELRVGAVRILVVHDLAELHEDPVVTGFQAVVSGHSHRPVQQRFGSVLYVNPGSAGPRRFKLPIAAGCLRVRGTRIEAELFELPPTS